MLYNCENPLIKLLSVDRLSWKGGQFRVQPRNYGALAYRVTGSGLFRCGGKEYAVGANDVLYLPAGLGYDVEYTDTEIIVFHFISLNPGKEPEVYTINNTEQIYTYFLEALSLWNRRTAGHEAHIISLFYKCLARLHERSVAGEMPPDFLDAVSYINGNFRNPELRVSSACRHSAMSETTFRQLFKQFYAKTPVDYITDLRLENARNLIATGAPIATAAEESGFADPKYFSRVVKRKYFCTPKDLKTFGK